MMLLLSLLDIYMGKTLGKGEAERGRKEEGYSDGSIREKSLSLALLCCSSHPPKIITRSHYSYAEFKSSKVSIFSGFSIWRNE